MVPFDFAIYALSMCFSKFSSPRIKYDDIKVFSSHFFRQVTSGFVVSHSQFMGGQGLEISKKCRGYRSPEIQTCGLYTSPYVGGQAQLHTGDLC